MNSKFVDPRLSNFILLPNPILYTRIYNFKITPKFYDFNLTNLSCVDVDGLGKNSPSDSLTTRWSRQTTLVSQVAFWIHTFNEVRQFDLCVDRGCWIDHSSHDISGSLQRSSLISDLKWKIQVNLFVTIKM